ARYLVTTMLHSLKSADLARTEDFNRVFAAMFTELSFGLKKSQSVEAVIDLIEALDGGEGLRVSYPSDYRECIIGVEGIDVQLRCSGAALEMVFPRAGSPGELIERFAEIRSAFAVSRELAGIIG
ncbi:MAG: hypothetical protein ABIY47_09195, partial [Opitutaceae bacterium]